MAIDRLRLPAISQNSCMVKLLSIAYDKTLVIYRESGIESAGCESLAIHQLGLYLKN